MSSKDAENDVTWLSNKYCSGRSYIQSLFDPVQNYAIYGITKDQADILKERMKASKCISRFRTVKTNGGYYVILCFKYDRSKDKDRDEYIKTVKQAEAERARLAK
jgi:hypothetical protein